ncbi:unnamed protein product [Agarophyton chilense]|eukprot:gb/GEZJ01000886.1/.p1 GENE.gb/GEZJ01000886.1/~~gb/GEZJ01000886.1/.p1  ORF type:complete len:622 (+),score=98.10 gb/GEZJ01000886.1/:2015-3880(+)
MDYNHQLDCCPSCSTPLTLFTPRERLQHANECLDSEHQKQATHEPSCAICSRNLNFLTPAARQEHVNRCLDVTLSPRPRQRRPVRKRPRSTSATSSRVPRQELHRKKCDAKVVKLLTLLGLERYSQRFADEDIDLDTLRILKDEDFVALRIPDAARRRIADALHAVPILDGLQTPTTTEPANEAHIVPTQKFATSKLGAALQREKSLFDDDDDDFEYRPTQTTPGSANEEPEKVPSAAALERVPNPRATAAVPETIDLITPTKEDKTGPTAIQPTGQTSDSSDFDFENDMLLQSQISLETKIEKWKEQQTRKEEMRHQDQMAKIESKYRSMIARLEGKIKSPAASPQSEPIASIRRSDGTNHMEPTPIDLTTELSHEAECVAEQDLTKKMNNDEDMLRPVSRGGSIERRVDNVSVLDCCSDSDEEFVRQHVLKSPPTGYKSLLPALDFGSESEGLEDLNQKERLRGNELLFSGNEDVEATKEGLGRSDDDLLDLFHGSSPGKLQSSDLERNVADRLSLQRTDSDSSSEELHQTQKTKLKKKRKVTNEEISAAIRKDKSLYDRILKVESVSYEVILQSIRRSGTAVSRKALTNYLHSEGIMYKGDVTSKSSKAYMKSLNSQF